VPDDLWLYVSIAFGTTAVALVILLIMEREKRKPLSKEAAKPAPSEILDKFPLPVSRTVTSTLVQETRDKLRIMDLEREILSYAIRRLYEAHAEGKISEEERDRLMLKYKEDLMRIKEETSRGESIVALNELERMREEFVKLFSERFEELNKRIEEVRLLSGFAPPEPEKPPEEEKKEVKAAPPRREREVSKPRAPSPKPEKSEAEKKIEQIMAEVEKVLERLGQMEVEE